MLLLEMITQNTYIYYVDINGFYDYSQPIVWNEAKCNKVSAAL